MKDEKTVVGTTGDLVAARNWTKVLAAYREPNTLRSLLEIVITALPFSILWIATCVLIDRGFWPALLLAIPAAGLLVRMFMIQHDCGHGAFFRRRAANDWTGRVIGVLTMTPYDLWRRSHATHHATSGNLDRRGIGDIKTLTVGEYRMLSLWRRLGYRLYRHPVVMFGVGPALLFVVQNRLPFGFMRGSRTPWISTMATNAAIIAVVSLLVWLVGIEAFLLVHMPIMLLAASIGVWLFFVQHQFEDTFWERDYGWKLQTSALLGSSHYDLPVILRWFTANIGIHHVHHLCSRIPYYRLPRTLKDYPELADVSRLTLKQSLRCVRLTLWDESRRMLVSFRQARNSA